MTELNAWLKANQWSQGDLARKLGTTRQAVSQWCTGKVAPGVYYVLALEALTNGQVGAQTWLDQHQRLAILGLGANPARPL